MEPEHNNSNPPEFSKEQLTLLDRLKEKYSATGQNLDSYLEGLLYADYLDYWDYIHLDTLLSLQTPRTRFPDEQIFIIYHQITELYFKLIRSEIKQVADDALPTVSRLIQRFRRINRYLDALITSFDVMVDGMDREQFLHFRMALLPASGFQSVQFRLIEIESTNFSNLLTPDASLKAADDPEPDFASLYTHLYWREGATELASGNQTLTLRRFDAKYRNQMLRAAGNQQFRNLQFKTSQIQPPGTDSGDAENDDAETLKLLMRRYDTAVNVNWRLAHYKSAVKYLHRNPESIAATGGTNWQKYLPPRFQRRMFFPDLWNSEEKENWGRIWVEHTLKELGQ
ncbi:MAG: tryptophan 2,3-dioxygenase family protein [Bacteroidota bacterium]